MGRSSPSVDLRFCETHVTMKIELHDGTIYRFGSATLSNVPEDTGSFSYVAHLMRDSPVRQTLTRTADQSDAAVQNVDRTIGLTINDVSQTLSGAKVSFSKVFKPNEGGEWERKVLLTGEISNVEIDENVAEIKVVSEIAPNVAFIGQRPLQNHCPLVFKGKACGYTGGLTTCNKVYESAGGCSGRNNQHRFGGIVVKGELSRPIVGGFDGHIDPYDTGRGFTPRYPFDNAGDRMQLPDIL